MSLPSGNWQRANNQFGTEATLVRQEVAKGNQATVWTDTEHDGHTDARLYYHDLDGVVYFSVDQGDKDAGHVYEGNPYEGQSHRAKRGDAPRS